ncbi:unnamed protein product [Prunus armeniaca]
MEILSFGSPLINIHQRCRTDLFSACHSLDPHGYPIMVLPFGKLGDADCRGAEGHCRRELPKASAEGH